MAILFVWVIDVYFLIAFGEMKIYPDLQLRFLTMAYIARGIREPFIASSVLVT